MYANLQSKIFFIWFACCFICIAFVYFYIYETKGLTLEQVDELYNEVSSARKSTRWTPTYTFKERAPSTVPGGVVGGHAEKNGHSNGHSGVATGHHEEDRDGSV